MTLAAPQKSQSRPSDWGEWGECLVPIGDAPAELKATLRRHIGATPSWVGRLGGCRWLGFTVAEFMPGPVQHVDEQLWGLIGLIVSQDNSCRYCYGIQRAMFKMLGHSDEYLTRLERDFHSAGLSPATRAALTFARKISRADPRPRPEDFAELTRVDFSRTAIAEIAFAAAAAVFINRVSTILALPPEPLEALTERRVFRFIRPLLLMQMAAVSRLQRKPPEPAPVPVRSDGPGAAVVTALAESPASGALARALDGAFGSELLPRRTKALMAGVIARALGCATGEAEARTLLSADGLTTADVDEIFANLGSPKLDRRDARLVPFARDTVRYQPPDIQRRARAATVDLTPSETLEAVGVASLMNAVCRLSVLLELC